MTLPRIDWRRWALLATILLAFGLRIFRLEVQSLWYDEGVTAAIAQRGLAELTRWTANDIQPPLYYYLAAGWGRLAGWSEWSLRWPSVFCGVVAVALLAVLARRLTQRWAPALLAALLAALHPFLLYYAQEARMYTLLLALSLAAAYCLVRAADEPRLAPGWWMGYLVAAAAAVYTHYFAFFLLLALGIALAVDLWLGGRTRPGSAAAGATAQLPRRVGLLALAAADLAVLLLYLPWLANMLTRLRVDRSYWEGALKLDEALRHVAVSFTSGETVTERIALWLLLGYALVTAWAIYRLWRSWPWGRRAAVYGALWLIVPVAAVLALASSVPKFNARYVIVALPGLLLLWSAGLGAPLGEPAARRRGQLAANTVGVLLLVIGFGYAAGNWFFNPAFTKDEWRQLVTFLRSRLQSNEQVILVSGHAWPVWDYYAPDIPVVRLPALEILDVDAILDFADSGPALKEAFAEGLGKRGAWLVNWQEKVVDPDEVAPVQLELSGREKGQSETFYGLTLRRYSSLRAARFADAPPIAHAIDANFGGQVLLRGYRVLDNGDLLLFWEKAPGAAASGDLQMAVESFDASGAALAPPIDRRLAGYTYPSARWRPGEVVMGRVPASAWLGSTPQAGSVGFRLRVYDAAAPERPLTLADGRSELTVEPVTVVLN